MKHNACNLPNILGLSLIMMMVLVLGLSSHEAHAQTYSEQTLHDFEGAPIDGSFADGALINVNGTLYGTTADGGDNNNGAIYSVSTNGSGFSMLYSFSPTTSGINTDGASPTAALLNVNGILYGTTFNGGANGFGTVFSFDPATDTETVIYNFAGGTADGGNPHASLILLNNLLYGTTEIGGANNKGTVFSIDPSSHANQLIYSFGAGAADGASPDCTLTAVNGVLYGTTYYGDSLDYGIIFSLDPATKVEHVLHNFTGMELNSDGAHPGSSLIAINGILYGTTYQGGTSNVGTIFSVKTDGSSYQPIYSFQATSSSDGAGPVPGLISISGKLYGTTTAGGSSNNGTVFSFDPATSTETTLYQFSASDTSGDNGDGSYPFAGLLSINGTLYGTTNSGGDAGHGTIFALSPATVPSAHNDACSIKYNTGRTNAAPGVLANDSSGGEGPLTAALVTSVTHGHLTLGSDGSFTYTPNTGYAGTDTFTYQAVNPIGHSNTATVTLTVIGALPVAHNDGCSIKYNTARTNSAPGVLSNDDAGGSPVTATLVTNVTHGTLTLRSDGSFTYTPNTGYAGTDTFTYKDTNAIGTSNTATVTLTVIAATPTAKNDGCTINHNTARTIAAPGVMVNDDNGGSSPMTASLVSNVSHGTLSFHSDGSFTYTPNTGYSGTDTFTYKDTTAIGTSNTATVTLTVQ